MTAVLALLLVNGVLGAVDTLWYHEHVAGLARHPDRHRTELRLHAGRDAVYAVLYGTIGWWQWRGAWVLVLAGLLAAEIAVTLTDFVVEDRTRTVGAGERVLHAAMAVVYGAMLARLAPELAAWGQASTALGAAPGHGDAAPGLLALAVTLAGVGIALSGARDALAAARPGRTLHLPRRRRTRGRHDADH